MKEMDLKSMAKLVRNLPKYQDELRSLNVHVDIASALNKQIDSGRLTEFGALEQVRRVTQGCVPVMASAFASMFSSGVSAPPCLDYFRLHRPAALPPLHAPHAPHAPHASRFQRDRTSSSATPHPRSSSRSFLRTS